mmetsp:Transcript_3378/g.4970  ORF Transcript_3378/g.4970 Transcript_3378/m.4970 type:complete len:257 (+) Transcript_3378:17-787(+)
MTTCYTAHFASCHPHRMELNSLHLLVRLALLIANRLLQKAHLRHPIHFLNLGLHTRGKLTSVAFLRPDRRPHASCARAPPLLPATLLADIRFCRINKGGPPRPPTFARWPPAASRTASLPCTSSSPLHLPPPLLPRRPRRRVGRAQGTAAPCWWPSSRAARRSHAARAGKPRVPLQPRHHTHPLPGPPPPTDHSPNSHAPYMERRPAEAGRWAASAPATRRLAPELENLKNHLLNYHCLIALIGVDGLKRPRSPFR